jgi:hypothetical protein
MPLAQLADPWRKMNTTPISEVGRNSFAHKVDMIRLNNQFGVAVLKWLHFHTNFAYFPTGCG